MTGKPTLNLKTFTLSPKNSLPEGGGNGKEPPEGTTTTLPSDEPARPTAPKVKRNPLHRYSLRGRAADLEACATETIPLLGEFVMQGQGTMIYAQPNAGKTLTVLRLVIDAIAAGRIDPNLVFYVNADDSSRGLAQKVRLLQDIGAHMLAPGEGQFRAAQFVDKLLQAIEEDTARGTLVILDTLKKFTNLMDKGRSAEFAQVCRQYVMKGGTIVALGHTAKSKNADGTPRYQGTTDILEDFDAVYVAEPMKVPSSANERAIRFTQLKSRAESPEAVAYVYSTDTDLTYTGKLASLRAIYPEELDAENAGHLQFSEKDVINNLSAYINQHGGLGQEKILKVVANMGEASRATVRMVLDRYTGPDPAKHIWNFRKGDRGIRQYYLLPSGNDLDPDAED